MRWEDEPYVKIYVRDTPEFLGMSLMARCLLHELIRKVDRAGRLKVGKLGIQGIAYAVRATIEEVEPPVLELLREGRLIWHESSGYFLVPNHIEAQTTPQSDVSRKRREREHARALLASEGSGGGLRLPLPSACPAEDTELPTDPASCDALEGATPSPEAGAVTRGQSDSSEGNALAEAVPQRTPGHGQGGTRTFGHAESRAVTPRHAMSLLEEKRKKRREEREERGSAPARMPAESQPSGTRPTPTLTPIGTDRKLSATGKAYADTVGVTDIESVFRSFVDYHLAEAKVAADWEAVWRRWCDRELRIQRRERERGRGGRTVPSQHDDPGAPRGWEMPSIVYPPKTGLS